MPFKTKTAFAALFVFGSAGSVLADVDDRIDHLELIARTTISAGILDPEITTALGGPLCRRGVTEMAWIKLTEPSGKPIHISVEQVTSVRSDTQIPGAKAQLDLASGKIQGVQENADQVMQLIVASTGPRANDNCA